MILRLTFDDGPSLWTADILDVLSDYNCTATFFVLGANVAANGPVLRRMAAEGHAIGNHTWNHYRLPPLRDVGVLYEFEATSQAILQTTGTKPTLWRPPHLDSTPHVDQLAARCGLERVMADIAPRDWDSPGHAVVEHVAGRAKPNAIVDLHDGVAPRATGRRVGRQHVVWAVEQLLFDGFRSVACQ